jgi:hypothetical protein
MPPKKQPTKTIVVERVITVKETRNEYKNDPKPKPKPRGGACHRCGRTSHWVADCYAKTDTDGNELSDNEDE